MSWTGTGPGGVLVFSAQAQVPAWAQGQALHARLTGPVSLLGRLYEHNEQMGHKLLLCCCGRRESQRGLLGRAAVAQLGRADVAK
jgi:hypothetical protein